MQPPPNLPAQPEAALQLLLFIDKRSSSVQQYQQVCDYLNPFRSSCQFDLKVIEMGEHPYLVEHFKLVASPALIKIFPEPKQILAGSNLIQQLKTFWPQWLEGLSPSLLDSESALLALDVEQSPEQLGEIPFDEIADDLSMIIPVNASNPVDLTTTAPSTGTMAGAELTLSNEFPSAMAYSAELLRLTDQIFRLRQENAELQAQTLFKDQVISMLAHDLRNPLTAAAIALETLELGLKPKVEDRGHLKLTPELTAQLLKHARTQTRAIDRMITDILQNAREKAFQFKLQPEELALSVLCHEVLDYLRKQFLAKNQTIETDIPCDLPLIYADRERLRQVLINLLDNAIKYTPESGKIVISMLHRTSQKVQVSICDTGPGIPEDSQESIFEDHVRLQRDREQSGYGIGLSVCQRIIRAHYGQIWVNSVPSQGSCFHFTLPVFRR